MSPRSAFSRWLLRHHEVGNGSQHSPLLSAPILGLLKPAPDPPDGAGQLRALSVSLETRLCVINHGVEMHAARQI